MVINDAISMLCRVSIQYSQSVCIIVACFFFFCVRNVQKVIISFVVCVSVGPVVRMNNLGFSWMDFRQILRGGVY
jgi:hypothetical protein